MQRLGCGRPYNVNVPNRPLHELAGVRVTSLSTHSCLDNYQLAVTNGERLQVQRIWREREQTHPTGSDAWAIANSFISLTRLRLLRDAGHETFVLRDAQIPHPIPVFIAGISLNAAPSPNGA